MDKLELLSDATAQVTSAPVMPGFGGGAISGGGGGGFNLVIEVFS